MVGPSRSGKTLVERLMARQPEVRAQLLKRLEEWMAARDHAPGDGQQPQLGPLDSDDSQFLEQLRALGYIE